MAKAMHFYSTGNGMSYKVVGGQVSVFETLSRKWVPSAHNHATLHVSVEQGTMHFKELRNEP